MQDYERKTVMRIAEVLPFVVRRSHSWKMLGGTSGYAWSVNHSGVVVGVSRRPMARLTLSVDRD